MSYGTKQLRAYKIELPFYEQPKKLESHYTSLIEPLLKEDYANEQAKQNLIALYRDTINLTIEAIKDEFEMEVTSGELISVILQHPYFQSRWLSPRYCRDYGDCPLSFQDFFAGAVQNGIKPKWIGKTLDIEEFVKLGMEKGRFETTNQLKYFIEKDLLPHSELVELVIVKDLEGIQEEAASTMLGTHEEWLLAQSHDYNQLHDRDHSKFHISGTHLGEPLFIDNVESKPLVKVLEDTNDKIIVEIKKNSSVFSKISKIATLVLSDKSNEHKLLKQYRK